MIIRGGILRVQPIHWHTVHVGYVGEGSVVFDLGAGVGNFARAIVAETGCLCYAAEPNPHQFRHIPDDARINKYLMAIADRRGTVRLNVSYQPASSSILHARRHGNRCAISQLYPPPPAPEDHYRSQQISVPQKPDWQTPRQQRRDHPPVAPQF